MKKLTKALLGLVAAVAMMLTGMLGASSAVAADTYTITINNTTNGYTYQAYQVFSGTLNGDKTVLSNIAWGNGVDGAGLLTALKDSSDTNLKDKFTNATDAAGVADVLGANKDDAAFAKAFAAVAGQHLATVAGTSGNASPYTIGNLAAGYYLVKNSAVPAGDYTYTDFILDVVKDTKVTPKGTTPTVEKKVEDNKDDGTGLTDWQDSADWSVNDTVPYKLDGTLPDNYASYNKYPYTFHDTYSKGLTINAGDAAKNYDGITVYAVNGKDANGKDNETQIASTSYTVTVTKDGNGEDDQPLSDEDKKDGYDGGTIKVAFADLKTATAADGTTPLTIDFNTKIRVKYEATVNANALIGSKGNPNKVYLEFANKPNDDNPTTGKTPVDAVTVFTFTLVVNKVGEDGKTALPGAGFTLQKKGKDGNWANFGDPISPNGNDKPTTFNFSRLDAGEYKLIESTVPDGYNKMADITFTVVAVHDTNSATPGLTKLEVQGASNGATFTPDKDKGTITTTVTNKKGSSLPSTGGMGTTILYIAGVVCVAAAGLWFGLRRRFAANR